MIISSNRTPPLQEFQTLMANTDLLLNTDAKTRETYYKKRGGKDLEVDVFQAIQRSAMGTSFEGTIELVSGSSFPDIVAHKYYGVEVKSTEKDKWTSIGSSILESTRNADVKRIYLTFGKLGSPVEFLSRPYEDCLSGIAVTHYPRYQIDMRLGKGETIFDKMGVEYDTLRQMENPVVPVSKYYKSKLKQGESLWWATGSEEETVPATVKLWSAVPKEKKEYYVTTGYTLFPELFNTHSTKKYNRYALWLATQKGIVNTNIRDGFSAGGQILMRTTGGIEVKMPAVFGRVLKYKHYIEDTILNTDEELLKEYWEVDKLEHDRVQQWVRIVSREADSGVGYSTALSVLQAIFYEHF